MKKYNKRNQKICDTEKDQTCNLSTFGFLFSLFREEINACDVVHTRYVMDACDHVRPIILLPPMMRTSFVLVALTRLIVSKPKHRVP